MAWPDDVMPDSPRWRRQLVYTAHAAADLRRTVLGKTSPVVDGDAVLLVDGDEAEPPVLDQDLIDPHPGCAHQGSDVALSEPDRNPHPACRIVFPKRVREGKQLPRHAPGHVLIG